MIDYLTNYGQIDINIINLIIGILIAFILDLIVIYTFSKTHRGMSYDSSFLITLLLMGPILSVIIVVIGHNIALSIGLVGSLSIVRFRTVIKDSRDLIFLLWAIAIGLGCGSENWYATIVASLVISGLIFSVYYLKFGDKNKKDLILIINSNLSNIDDIIKKDLITLPIDIRFRSCEKTGENYQFVYEIKNNNNLDDISSLILSKLENNENIKNVSILSPSLTLPV